MAGESTGWGLRPREGDTRLAVGLSIVTTSRGAPPVLPREWCSRASPSLEAEVQLPGGPWSCFCGGESTISLLEMNSRPKDARAQSAGDTFHSRGEGCGVPGTEQVLIH